MLSVFNVFCLEQRQQALATYPLWALYCLNGPLKGQNEWIRHVDLPVSSLCFVHVVKLNHSKSICNSRKMASKYVLQTRGRSQSCSNCSIIKSFEGGNEFHYTYFVVHMQCNLLNLLLFVYIITLLASLCAVTWKFQASVIASRSDTKCDIAQSWWQLDGPPTCINSTRRLLFMVHEILWSSYTYIYRQASTIKACWLVLYYLCIGDAKKKKRIFSYLYVSIWY